nr:PaaI family thioesterase [Roseomonas sp. GC11]
MAAEWGIEVVSAGAGAAVLRLPPRAALLRPGPTVSGPALMGLADIAIWAAAMADTEGEQDALTGTLTASFLRPAGSGAVLAEARLVRQGRRTLYAEVWLRAEGSAQPCAHVTSTWLRV